MQKTIIQLGKIILVGTRAESRTNNILESNPDTALITKTVQSHFSSNVPTLINERINQGKNFCVYTEYESDFNGNYTYFIGEEVSSLEDIAPNLSTITIPAQKYVKFTSAPGKMPEVCINMWMDIWQMTSDDLGGMRSYIADFEIYDERSHDPENSVLDIYIGII